MDVKYFVLMLKDLFLFLDEFVYAYEFCEIQDLLATPPKELIPGGGDCLTTVAKEIMVRSVAGVLLLRHYFLVVDLIDSLKFGLALYFLVSN